MDTLVDKFCKTLFPHHIDLDKVFQMLDKELNEKQQEIEQQCKPLAKINSSSDNTDGSCHD